MKYQVIKRFKDTHDKGHIYNAGDKYPRKGKVDKGRAESLVGTSNRYGYPFIREVDEDDKG